MADVQIVCVHLRACVIVRRYVDLGFNFLVTQLQGDCVSKEFLILWVYKTDAKERVLKTKPK